MNELKREEHDMTILKITFQQIYQLKELAESSQ